MSYYFAIIGTQDNPLFEYEFGTSKQGGDGQPRFSEQARHLNQFILHSSLDIVEELQWTTGQMYLKAVDKFFNNYISAFVTAGGARFMLLHQPLGPGSVIPGSSSSISSSAAAGGGSSTATNTASSSSSTPTAAVAPPLLMLPSSSSSSRSSTSIPANPTSPQTEEAVRGFFADVYESYVKAVMSPFHRAGAEIRSPVFRARVAAAGRKYL